jgi:hypothetical protein
MDIHTAAYQQFLLSLRGSREWDEFVDYDAFRASDDSEKDDLRQRLIDGLQNVDDARIPRAIAALFDLPTAVAVLLGHLHANPHVPGALMDLIGRKSADALYALASDAQAALPQRRHAFDALDNLSWPEVTVFMARSLDDDAVAEKAANVLFERLRLSDQAGSPTSWALAVRRGLSSGLPSIRRRARQELKRIGERGGPRFAGVTSAELSLTPNQRLLLDGGASPSALEPPGDERTRLALELALVDRAAGDRAQAVALLQQIGAADVIAEL